MPKAPAFRSPRMAVGFGLPLAMLIYVAAVIVICHAAGYPNNFNSQLYTGPLYAGYFFVTLGIFLVVLLRHALGTSGRPLLWFRRTWQPMEFLRRLAGALPFLITMPFFMAAFTAMKNLLNDLLPFSWDEALSNFGKSFGIEHQAYELLFIQNAPITRVLESLYASWGILLVAMPFAVSLRPLNCPLRTRFLVSFVLILVFLGNLAAGVFMSAGPFWLQHQNPEHNDFAPLFTYLRQVDPNGEFSAILFQQYLLTAHARGLAYLATGISAFPSIHVAMMTLFALFAWSFGAVPRVLSLIGLAIIFYGSVQLGWHYAIDGYAGIAGACAIYASVGWIQLRLGSRTVPDRAPERPSA